MLRPRKYFMKTTLLDYSPEGNDDVMKIFWEIVEEKEVPSVSKDDIMHEIESATPQEIMKMIQLYKYYDKRDGNYHITCYDPHDMSKRKQHTLQTKNEKRAQADMDDIILAYKDKRANLHSPYIAEQIAAKIFGENKPKELLMSKFIDEYIAALSSLAKNTRNSYSEILERFRIVIGDKNISYYTQQECETFISNIAKDYEPETASKYYRTLNTAFNKAVQWELIKKNPFSQYRHPKDPEKDADYFSEEDLSILFQAIPIEKYEKRRLRNISIIAFETGWRLDELLNLKISSVDFNNKKLYVRNCVANKILHIKEFRTKSKQQRSNDLTEKAEEAIRQQMKDNNTDEDHKNVQSVYVFPSQEGTVLQKDKIDKPFKKFRELALPNRPGLHFHSLRHGFGTRLALMGFTPLQIQKAMGHSSVNVTQRYFHLQNLDNSGISDALNACPSYNSQPRVNELALIKTKGKVAAKTNNNIKGNSFNHSLFYHQSN